MNICYLIDVAPSKFHGGGQVHLENLVKQLNLRFTIYDLRIFSSLSSHVLFRLFWMIEVIPQIVFYHYFKNKFSLIHAHSVPAIAAGKVLSMILGIPIVVTVHGYNETRLTEKFILTRIRYDKQIVVARNFLEYKNVNKPIYIPNGVDLQAFKSLSTHQRINTSTILFVGRRNDPVKGFKILEQAMDIVKKNIPSAELLVADGCVDRQRVISFYHRANLLVIPSLSEGFPLVLLEAWASKLPVVATRVGEIPYLMEGSHPSMAGCFGYLVEPGNPVKLADAIMRALKNSKLAKMGENGYNLAKKYTWRRMATSTEEVYKETIANK